MVEGEGGGDTPINETQQQLEQMVAQAGDELEHVTAQVEQEVGKELEAFAKTNDGQQLKQISGELGDGLGEAQQQISRVLSSLEDEDPDEALNQVSTFLSGVGQYIAKGTAISTIIQARLKTLELEIKRKLREQAEGGLADVAAVWHRTEGGALGLMSQPSVDELVGLLGPVYLKALDTYWRIQAWGAPIFIIAMVACVIIDSPLTAIDGVLDCEHELMIRVWFYVKIGCDVLLWGNALYVNHKYNKWNKAVKQEQKDATQAAEQAASGSAPKHGDRDSLEKTLEDLVEINDCVKSSSLTGLAALRVYDEITTSCMYTMAEWVSPLSFGWDSYGLYLAIEVYVTSCSSMALPCFLYVYSFWFVFCLAFRSIGLLLWIAGLLISTDCFKQWVLGKCAAFDADNHLPFPLCTFLFEKVVMRNKAAAKSKALIHQKQVLMSRRDLMLRELDNLDRELDSLKEDCEAARQEEEQEEQKLARQREEALASVKVDGDDDTSDETQALMSEHKKYGTSTVK